MNKISALPLSFALSVFTPLVTVTAYSQLPADALAAMPETASQYAEMCSAHVGLVPKMNCDDGVVIPIYVNGEEVFEHQEPGACDDFDFKGTCNIGSRIGRLEGMSANGLPMPEVVWVYFCRSTGPLGARWSSAQMIGHNRETGATCFFEQGDQFDYFSYDEKGLLLGDFPGPEEPEFDNAFIPPPVQCVECHEANPFIHNPWISGARLPEDPSQPVIPEIYGPNSPYWVVGGRGWNTRTAHIEDNGCVSCHRASVGVASLFELRGISVNEFMPPNAPGTMSEDYEELLNCFEQGALATPGCNWMTPPAGEYSGGITETEFTGSSVLKQILDDIREEQ